MKRRLRRRYGRGSRAQGAAPHTRGNVGACPEIDENTRRDSFNAIAEHHAAIFGVPFTPLPMTARRRRSAKGGAP